MSYDIEDYILHHFTSLHDDEMEFTSGHSETQSHLLDQLVEEEAKEIEEALKVLAKEAIKRQKRKSKQTQATPQDVGEPSIASVVPHKRKASWTLVHLALCWKGR